MHLMLINIVLGAITSSPWTSVAQALPISTAGHNESSSRNQMLPESLIIQLESAILSHDVISRYESRLMRPAQTGPIDIKNICGRGAKNAYVIESGIAIPREFPWQAFLLVKYPADSRKKSSYCGGTLIDRQWIVTSATCLDKAKQVSVILGAHDLSSVYEVNRTENYATNIQGFVSDSIYYHPKWNRDTFTADVALIRLPVNVTFSSHVRPICLPSVDNHDFVNRTVTVTGWGTTFDDSKANPSPVLRKAVLKTVPNEQCSSVYGDIVTQDKICSRRIGISEDSSCLGDRGGPMSFRSSHGKWILIGVASFFASVGCQPAYPDGFTQVRSYLDWINENISRNRVVMSTSPADLGDLSLSARSFIVSRPHRNGLYDVTNDNLINKSDSSVHLKDGIQPIANSLPNSTSADYELRNTTPSSMSKLSFHRNSTSDPVVGLKQCPHGTIYANPNACHTFNMCSGGRVYLYGCPGGLVFNPSTSVCDLPRNVPSCNQQ